MTSGAKIFRVGVILTPGFSLMAYASLVEPMRGANLVCGAALYDWTNLSIDGSVMTSGSGLDVLTSPLPALSKSPFEMVVVVGGLGGESYRDEKLAAFLRQTMRRDLIVGSLSTASFVLARAGCLEGRRCTVHWDYIEAFREAFPSLDVTNELFVIQNRVFTCAGGTASMDLMLQIIREREGESLAAQVSDTFIYGASRQPHDSQRQALRIRLANADPVVVRAIEIMEQSIETPMRLPALARRVGVSVRHLERLFDRAVRLSPTRHCIELRLQRARNLLWHTKLSVSEVGLACGYSTASHFARSYRIRFAVQPSADRRARVAPLGLSSNSL